MKIPAFGTFDGYTHDKTPIYTALYAEWEHWAFYVLEGKQMPDGDTLLHGYLDGLDWNDFCCYLLSDLQEDNSPGILARHERDHNYSGMLGSVTKSCC